MKSRLLIYLILILSLSSAAQSLSNFRSQTITVKQDSLQLDSLSLVPASLIVSSEDGKVIDRKLYQLNESKALIIFSETLLNRSLRLAYRVLPINLEQASFGSLYNLSLETDSTIQKKIFKLSSGYSRSFEDFSGESLNKSGHISRGLNFGNNQDVVVNSSLDMQLSGQLSEGINIKASISDNNIPIQPEGNTQQIQEFDKVFITLYNDNTSLTLGDFEINKPKGYFMNSNKKVMGGSIDHRFKFKKDSKKALDISVSGAIAKGKFNRMNIDGQEGIQGPYQLRGANNETYIIILSGTEKVYIDGELLKRGENNDYTIDYNLAEVVFTTHRIITKDARIVIEFEYSDKNYAKFTVANSNVFKTKNSEFWLNVLSDQESKNQPINADYSDLEKQILVDAGDNPLKALSYSIDSLGFSQQEVRYQKVDSLGNDSVFVYSTDPEKAIYRINFAYVGENNGDYEQVKSSANGRVFEWQAPLNGQPQGSYLPIKVLIPSKSQQMISTGGRIQLKSYTKIEYEIALSQFDANTYSTKDAGDDVGYAYKMNLRQELLRKDTSKNQLQVVFMLENANENFTAFERYRSVEFNRNWNIDQLSGLNNQSYGAELFWKKKDWAQLSYQIRMLKVEQDYEGIKHNLHGRLDHNKWKANTNVSWLKTDFTEGRSDFIRSQSSLTYQLTEGLSIGANGTSESNRWYNTADSLSFNSKSFLEWEGFALFESENENNISLSYNQRQDKGLSENSLSAANKSRSVVLGSQVNSLKNQKLSANISWREVTVLDSLISNIDKNEQNFLGKLEHNLRLYKNAISFRTFYEISSGLELKKDFTYIEVAAGQGIYQWVDYDEDGVQDKNEFEKAYHDDEKKFIKVNIPSNEFVKAFSNQFSESINLYPYKVWRNKSGIRKLVSKFSNTMNYKVKKKVSDDNFSEILNPFKHAVDDTSLINLSQSIRNTFSFNKINPVYGLDYSYINHGSKLLLSNGFDSRTTLSHGLNLRINFSSMLSFNNKVEYNEKSYTSDFFSSNDYFLEQWADKVEMSYQINQNLRLIMHYQYKIKDNTKGDKENAELNELGFEFKYSVASKSNIQINIDYFNFKYNDEANSSIAFEMLEGLLPGNNAKWSALFQTQLSKYLQLNLSYLGRVAEDSEVIHNGQAQLRAFF